MRVEWRTVPAFPLGKRGERPVYVHGLTPEIGAAVGLGEFRIGKTGERFYADAIPGVVTTRYEHARCTFDALPFVMRALGQECPPLPIEKRVADLLGVRSSLSQDFMSKFMSSLPGLAEFQALGLWNQLRDYQQESLLFHALRAYGIEATKMRGGKSRILLALAILRGAARVLIIGPAKARRGWQREIAKVLGYETLVLFGKACDRARRWCIKCGATGRVQDPLMGLSYCPHCIKGNGQSSGQALYLVHRTKCRAHEWKGEAREPCAACAQGLLDVIRSTRFLYVNPSLLQAYVEEDFAGQERFSSRLRGQSEILREIYRPDFVILDESHAFRSWTARQSGKDGNTQRERIVGVVSDADFCFAATGTPLYTSVADYWAQLDAISLGAVTGGGQARLPFAFHSRYLAFAGRGQYGYQFHGVSKFAESELPGRLAVLQICHEYERISRHLPPVTREVVIVEQEDFVVCTKRKGSAKPETEGVEGLPSVDLSGADFEISDLTPDNRSRREHLIYKGMRAALPHKLPVMVERVMAELAEGRKCIVFVKDKQRAVHEAYRALEEACQSREHKKRMEMVNCRLWIAHGGISIDTRAVQTEVFSAHTGAGVYVATIDSTDAGISLSGASTIHFLQLDWVVGTLQQAERRSYMEGLDKLHILYYCVEGSIDEHIQALVLPKLENLAKVDTKMDTSMGAAFSALRQPEEMSAIDLLKLLAEGVRAGGDILGMDEEDFSDDE